MLYQVTRDRPVLKIPDPKLRLKAEEIDRINKKTELLINDMMRILRRANGVGLAAPQLGISQQVIVVAPDEMKPTAMINPIIIKSEGEQTGIEGCLSIPALYGDVTRASYVEVEAFDRKGRRMVWELEGLPARVVQHEIDHLHGVLFIDKVIKETLHWQDPDSTDAAE
ncbi:peptide deformylase [bacterium]|nr:MAG: peptide deformylase [bacterium]